MAIQTGNDGDDVMSEINVTPLVDVMLVLLVVFIVTAPLLSNAVHVNLPDTAATAPPTEQKATNVSIDVGGKVFLDKEEVPVAELEPRLRQRRAIEPGLELHLNADQGVSYGVVAKVMASIERAGVRKLAVLTQPE